MASRTLSVDDDALDILRDELSFGALLAKATEYLEGGQAASALTLLQEVDEDSPEHARALKASAQSVVDADSTRADLLVSTNTLSVAELAAYLQQLLSVGPPNSTAAVVSALQRLISVLSERGSSAAAGFESARGFESVARCCSIEQARQLSFHAMHLVLSWLEPLRSARLLDVALPALESACLEDSASLEYAIRVYETLSGLPRALTRAAWGRDGPPSLLRLARSPFLNLIIGSLLGARVEPEAALAALRSLRNLARDPPVRHMLTEAGALPALISWLAADRTIACRAAACEVLINIACAVDQKTRIVDTGAIPLLITCATAAAIGGNDIAILHEAALSVMGCLSFFHNEAAKALVASGVLQCLEQRVHADMIVTGSTTTTKALLAALDLLKNLLLVQDAKDHLMAMDGLLVADLLRLINVNSGAPTEGRMSALQCVALLIRSGHDALLRSKGVESVLAECAAAEASNSSFAAVGPGRTPESIGTLVAELQRMLTSG